MKSQIIQLKELKIVFLVRHERIRSQRFKDTVGDNTRGAALESLQENIF